LFITDLDRRAAGELKLDKPWLYDPKPQAECPACAEKIKPGVAVCRSIKHNGREIPRCARNGGGLVDAAAERDRRLFLFLNALPCLFFSVAL
jgi:hypothetical protein